MLQPTAFLSRLLLGTLSLVAAADAGASALFDRQAPLQASDTPNNMLDQFGRSVAIDGDVAAVSAALEVSGSGRPEPVYVYRKQAGAWVLQATLTSPAGSGKFGAALALQGGTLLIGAPRGGALGSGRAYVFVADGDRWVLQSALQPAAGKNLDMFGYAVALDGDRALVGAPGRDSDEALNHGAAYVYGRGADGKWTQQASLLASDRRASDVFGLSVALAGNSAFVGSVGAAGNAGAVYAFEDQGAAQWIEHQKLVAADGADGDGFGISLAATSTRIAVGAYHDDIDGRIDQGSVHLFARAGQAWVPERKLIAADGAAGEVLGWSVALSDAAVLAGGRRLTDAATRGNARLFRLRGGEWGEEQAPLPSNIAARSELAYAVAIDATQAMIGTPSLDIGVSPDRGQAFIFERRNEAWEERLAASSTEDREITSFGFALAIDHGTAFVGGPGLCAGFCPAAVRPGAAYAYRRDANGVMQKEMTVVPTPVVNLNGFGRALAVSGDTALVSAIGGYGPIESSGVYVFTRREGRWQEVTRLLDRNGAPVSGEQIALDNDTAIIGGPFDVWIFERGLDGWQEKAHYPAGSRERGDSLTAVALHGDTAAIGVADFKLGSEAEGVVYMLERRAGQWLLTARLQGSPAASGQRFGSDLALEFDTLLVGAAGNFWLSTQRAPTAYVFTRGALGWRQQTELTAPPGAHGELAVALKSDLAILGSYVSAGETDKPISVFHRSGNRWNLVDRVQSPYGARLAFDGETLLASDLGVRGTQIQVFRLKR